MSWVILHKNHGALHWSITTPFTSFEAAAFCLGEMCETGVTGQVVGVDDIAVSLGID
ncbi:hypothetical protein LCGC14_0143070 [marine sediment metagenome]|uniref:Uncharacterized protein n=1 Tax=marine sediment metagenome TaxID=412755 RepID=A0A0F9V1C7_9ZZZZ